MRRLLLAVFCCALAGASAAGEADGAPRATGFVPSQIGKPHYRAAAPQRRGALRAGASLPSFYDVRSNGWVTAVKRQHNYGTYWALAGSLCANGYSAVDSWCMGLDPTNEASAITANLTFTNGAPCVTVSPATDRCEYVTEGRASLAEGAWSDALYDGTHKFFRITARPKTGQ